MKLALLGDIHGNRSALSAVLAAAREAGAERLLVTGDIVGYYFQPEAVLMGLAEWTAHMVRGNHEEMLRACRADPAVMALVERRYGSGLQVALDELSEQQLDDLCSLPDSVAIEVEGVRVLLCHGAPWDPNKYVYPDAPDEIVDRCAPPGFDVVVMGHTHYPMLRTRRQTLIVNPGSVGQPRDGQRGACWALLDTATRTVEHRVERYDATALVGECRRRHPGLPYLWEVLSRS